MKKTIFAVTVTAIAASAGAAFAADLPRGPIPYYSAPAPGQFNWSGPYAGLNAGYEWGKVTNSSINPSGFAGGGQAGYNWQSSQFVFGGETDIQFSGADDTFAPYKFSNPWFGTLRGRAGIALDNILLYATGGLAYGDLKAEQFGLSETKTCSAGPPASAWKSASRRTGRRRSSTSTWIWAAAPIRSPAWTMACRPTWCGSASTIISERQWPLTSRKTPGFAARGFPLGEPGGWSFISDLSLKYSLTTFGGLASFNRGDTMAIERLN